MSEREKIIAKIKKCLALSASSNEHEAAAALRQARKMMEQHGVSDLDMMSAEASETRTRAGGVKYPANWETKLAARIADAFSCRMIFGYNFVKDCGEWVFVGTGAAPEISEYAFKVLIRQAKSARSQYIKSRLKRCKVGVKTRRADLFCEGWVTSVTHFIKQFSGEDTNEDAINAYMSQRYPRLGSLNARDRNAECKIRQHDVTDFRSGQISGESAQLNRGMTAAESSLALE